MGGSVGISHVFYFYTVFNIPHLLTFIMKQSKI